MLKASDLRGMSPEELVKRKKELVQDLFVLKMKNPLGQLGNPLQIRFYRRDLARIETVLSERSRTSKSKS